MKNLFTLETRLSLNEETKDYLTNYVFFYNKICRKIWQIVKLPDFNKIYTRNRFNTYVCNRFNILKRTSNSIYSELNNKKKSLLELKKYELASKKNRYKVLIGKKEKLKCFINNLKTKVCVNKATANELIKYKKYKSKYYYLCNEINALKQKFLKLEEDIKSKKISMCFGGKKAFKSQYNLELNNYKNHIKWRNDFRKKRDKNIFYLGSKDESNGNQLAQLIYSSNDDSFTLKLRKEKKYEADGKYLFIDNIDFKYMKKELIDVLNKHKNNSSKLPLSLRIYRKNNKWYLQVIITIITNDFDTKKDHGVIGLDFNNGFISLSETNESGNLVGLKNYPLKNYHNKNKNLNEMLNVINNIVKYAKSVNKDISVENLNFNNKKSKSVKTNNKFKKKYNKMIHAFAYARYIFRLENKCHKLKVCLNKVNPMFTSITGFTKYAKTRKMTIHQAASYVIARRYQGFID